MAPGFFVSPVKPRAGALHGHIGVVESGEFRAGEVASLTIDSDRRRRIRSNHSATHLLHQALRETLGEHIAQKGSLVADDRLRFDFSQPTALSDADLSRVEDKVNAVIMQNAAVKTRVMPYDDAVAAGAIALFGEKYDEEVRVLTMGNGLEDSTAPYSVELCGGTHVARTGDIALFKIIAETAVASGVRRIEALTGAAARAHLERQARMGRDAADVLKTTLADLPARVEALLSERKRLEHELAEARKKMALGGGGGGGNGVEASREIAGVRYIGKVLEGVPAKELRGLIDQTKSSLESGAVALVGVNEGKAAVAVGVTDNLTDRLSAVDLVRAGAEALGGKGGGGRADMAQAGGPDGTQAAAAIEAIAAAMENTLH